MSSGHRFSPQFSFGLIALTTLVLILYGTLYPFEFHGAPDGASAFQTLFSTYSTPGGRGDVLANILLYLPLGFFIILSRPRVPSRGFAALVTFGAMLLSTSVELLQVYDTGRDPSMSDVYANTTGAFLGALAGVVLYRRFQTTHLAGPQWLSFPSFLIVCWLGFRLYPYVPVIDLHKYWHAVRPVLFAHGIPAMDLYRHTVVWLALALMLDEVFSRLGRWFILMFVPLVLGARVLIGEIMLSRAEVAGGAIAILLWVVFLWRYRARARVIAVFFTILVAAIALEPFHFSSVPHSFGWVPFRSFLTGSLVVNAQSFLEKSFLYGTLVWLAVRAGLRWSIAATAGTVLVFCLRLAQVYLPGRSAEITDAIILVLAAAIMRLLSPHGSESGRQSC